MPLLLTRPLVFFDLETTGIDITKDRIVEIALVKMNTDDTTTTLRHLIHPEMPIPPAATAIHGINNEMVLHAPPFKDVAHAIKHFIDGADLGGFNCLRFDIPILAEAFLRAGVDIDLEQRYVIDVQKIYHQMEPRNLSAAYRYYCNAELANAHSAQADAAATQAVFVEQLKKYSGLGNTVHTVLEKIGTEETVDFSKRIIKKNGTFFFNFGKHKDKPLEQVYKTEPAYFGWILNADFSLHTKKKVHEIVETFKNKFNLSHTNAKEQ